MKQTVIFFILSLCLIACGGDDGGKKEVKSTKKKKVAKKIDGSRIFKQYCVTCHGVAGDMGANGAFNLTTSKLTIDEKIAVITNGRNTMTPFKGLLSDEKIKAVAEYTETLKKE